MTADFFEGMYARAGGDDAAVPWQHAMSRPLIADWLESYSPAGHRRAIVVAAGLGDDAASLAALGLEVVAFDVSPTAIEWARSRHPDADVDWRVANLLAPPAAWTGAFDLVIEVFTIQSIEPAHQPEAAQAIRSFVAPGGTLVAIAMVHDGTLTPDGPPWPIHPTTVGVVAAGLDEVGRRTVDLDGHVSCVVVELVDAGTIA
ncbi:MAG: class I SAM-dependent methyltransferase [Ilumatobacteraceae bacterium]